MKRGILILMMGLGLSACGIPPGTRVVIPPKGDLKVGALYTSRQSDRNSGPVSLDRLCNIPSSIASAITVPPSGGIDEMDLTSSLSVEGGITGIQASVVSAELSGKLTDYYDLKLKGVTRYEVSSETARYAFALFMQRAGCRDTYQEDGRKFYVYQIRTAYVGDVSLDVKRSLSFNTELVAKLKALEPKAKLQFSKAYQIAFTGKQLVGVVDLIRR
jgi:hypothetical protein